MVKDSSGQPHKETTSSNKRIAKNTILLYFRMLFLMAITLYTSRVILNALGVEDYGINNVVAGFLSMFGILTSSLSSAISRFITVELGKQNIQRLKNIFQTALCVQIIMGIIIVACTETIGMWFLHSKMVIPEGRIVAAQWCLHCSSISIFINLINVPFNSLIVAHEKMSAFAYISILEAILKILICYALYISPYDRLITYVILGIIVSLSLRLIYGSYCKRNFEECQLQPKFNSGLFKEIWGFAGWNFFGNTSYILNTQGVNMLMNIFFGVSVNAARGIAIQANHAITQFVSNFMMAMNPQIIKSYAIGDKETAFALACRGARFSFYIMIVLALPAIFESETILKIWLKNPPQMSGMFLIWTIIASLTTAIGKPLQTLQNAHGDIRKYQIYITIVASLPFPLTWILFKLEFSVIWSYYVFAAIYWIIIFVRFYLVNSSTGIGRRQYLIGVVGRCHVVGIVSATMPLIIVLLMPPTYLRLVTTIVCSSIFSIVCILYGGMNKSERIFVNKQFMKFINKLH